MKNSIYLSLGLLSVVMAWMLSGAIASVPDAGVHRDESHAVPRKMKVRVLVSTAKEITREVVVQGELAPRRQVEIRAQTSSRVIGLPVQKGEEIGAGTLLIQLAKEDRTAQVKRAEAEVGSKELEVAAARKLKQQGLQAANRVKAAEAALAAARAELEKAGLELAHTYIKTPFAGVLEERFVELGSHLEKGDGVALLVDESVLKAVGRVSQQSAGKLRLGQEVKVRLLDTREAVGRVSYISRLGDAETHSFRVEAEVPNPDGFLSAGVSAELRIAIDREAAHFLSPAILSLDDSGEVGVKTVDDDNVVGFYPIELVRTEADGIWVSGLPGKARVIDQGQGFVNAGESVNPVPAT